MKPLDNLDLVFRGIYFLVLFDIAISIAIVGIVTDVMLFFIEKKEVV